MTFWAFSTRKSDTPIPLSFLSLRYLDLISVRQIEGVHKGLLPSMWFPVLVPLSDPLKYSIHAKELGSLMWFFLVSEALCCEPWISTEDAFEFGCVDCVGYCFSLLA